MSDTISRQAAIDVVDAVWSVTGDKNVAKVWDQIKDLPSAQPEKRTEERTETHACDLISRQAAIDDIKAVYEWHDTVTEGRILEHLRRLPSAQPEPIKINIEDFNKEDWERLKKEWGNTPITVLPAQHEIIRCKDCKHWRQQTNYQGAPLSFGFCESDNMWQSLYGETYEGAHIDTDDDFYCGYAKRRTDE